MRARVRVISIVIGALVTVPKGLEKEQEEFEIRGRLETIQITVVKLKGRTRRLLPPMSQAEFVVRRDNAWRAVYAGGTGDVFVNPATVHSWIKKNRWWAEWTKEMKCDNEAVWIEFLSSQHQKKETRSDEQNGQPQCSKMARMCLAGTVPEI